VSADDARLVLEPRKALIEREEARALLEKGLLERAIATARRAIEADPEDAMAWLILGAAEMESMHDADAAKTFRSCVQLAKRGPISECRAFVR
jgi:Flp pilus assembly protein TadD